MRHLIRTLMLVATFGLAGNVAMADSPPSLTVPDTHSVPTTGKVTLYRVQVQGLEFGRDEEEIDAEIFVTLDSEPDLVMGLRLHEDSSPVNTVIADTLREAYLTQTPVTIYHQIRPRGGKNAKIHLVQFNSK